MFELLFLLSFLVELQSNCFHMNLESFKMKEGFMIFVSLLFKRPVSWLSFLAPLFLHIIGLGFSQILLTSVALYFSSFFFPLSISKPNLLIDSKAQKQGQQDSLRQIRVSDDIVCNNDEEGETIPDEDSLIELSLPSGHYVGHHHYSTMTGQQDRNLIPDFRLVQLSSVEFEDDNLIEIDISIGSIKCSRFQIKA